MVAGRKLGVPFSLGFAFLATGRTAFGLSFMLASYKQLCLGG